MTTDTLRPIELAHQGAATPRIPSVLRRLAGEPLFHFILLGCILFALNTVITPEVPKERVIEVNSDVLQSITEIFASERQRDPTPQELQQLTELWILNEITYREALAQGLDKGDDMIRERIMQKMRLLIFSNLEVENPTEADLAQWLESRRSLFDVPERLSFFEVPIGGSEARAEAEETLRQIETGQEPESVRLRAHTFAQRPRQTVEEVFGKEFVEKMMALPTGRWQMLESPAGWHIIRLDSITPGRRVDIDEIRTQLSADWQQERARSLAIAAVRDMGKAYVIRRVAQP